jgi:hypothetical protein
LDLPVLADLVTKDGANVRIVILDQEKRARHDIREASPILARYIVRRSTAKPGVALLAAGDADGILPYTRVTTLDGAICASWRGGLTLQRARTLMGACKRLISPPKH